MLQSLQGADAQFNIERKRQLELSRLRRETRKAQAEEKFNAAVLVLGMAKVQQNALGEKYDGCLLFAFYFCTIYFKLSIGFL